MKNYAIIDIGSNTIRLCIYEVIGNDFKLIDKKRSVAGLASDVENGNLKSDGIKRLIAVLNDFKTKIFSHQVTQIFAFATASLRLVKNRETVLKKVLFVTSIRVKILSGKEEAEYSFLGATLCLNVYEGILVDIGGASTELVYFKNNQIVKSYSFPIGSLNSYEKYVSRIIPTKMEQQKIKGAVLEFLDGIDVPDSAYQKKIYGVGGSVRNTFKIYNRLCNNETNEMSYEKFKDILKLFKAEKKEYLTAILQTAPHRIHTIIPGMIILKTIARYFECTNICKSNFGIREGYLMKQIKGN